MPGEVAAGEKQLEMGVFGFGEYGADFTEEHQRPIFCIFQPGIGYALVDCIEKYMDIVPGFCGDLVQVVGETAQGLAPRQAENFPQMVRQTDVCKIGTCENHHGLPRLAQSFSPMAQLICLALTGLSQQRKNCFIG